MLALTAVGLAVLMSASTAAAAFPGVIAINTDHKPSKYWPPSDTGGFCSNGVCTGNRSNVYLQIVDLHGHERRKPVFLGSTGSGADGFQFATDAGGVSWLPGQS